MSTGARLDPDALAALEEQREFLRRSLADLDREHDAGDLDDDDHAALRADYQARLDALGAAVDEGRTAFATARADRRDPRRTAVIAAAVLTFALVCGFTVAHFAGRRPAGGTATGSTTADARAEMAVCLAGAGVGTIEQTVACYDNVLKTDPTNAEAKTYRAGIQLMANGDVSQINELIDVAESNPEYPDVHAFLAVAFDRIGRPDSALAELQKLDALNPSPLLTDLTADLRARLEAGTTSTTAVAPTTAPG